MSELVVWAKTVSHIFATFLVLLGIQALFGFGLNSEAMALAVAIGALWRTYRKAVSA